MESHERIRAYAKIFSALADKVESGEYEYSQGELRIGTASPVDAISPADGLDKTDQVVLGNQIITIQGNITFTKTS